MGDKLTVAHFNEHLSRVGGVETYLLGLISLLEEAGHEQHYIYARGNGDILSRIHELPELGQSGKSAEDHGYVRTSELLKSIKPDIVHVHRVYNLGVLKACLDYGPTIVTCHDYLYLCPAGSFFHRRTKTICERIVGPPCFFVTIFRHCLTPRPRYALSYYRRVKGFVAWKDRYAAVLCPSDYVRARLLQLGFSPSKTWTIPYFCPYEPLGTPRPIPNTPTILFVGRLRAIKGFDVFIQALGLVREVHGLIVGDITESISQAIHDLAQANGCTNRLIIRPWAGREDLRNFYQQTSVFVFPSLSPETLGIVGLEAMAHGVPVVASDVGGVRQWLRHQINGLLVPPKDVRALADAITTLLSDPQRLITMGQAAIETVRNEFLPAYHIERLLMVYRSVVGGRGCCR